MPNGTLWRPNTCIVDLGNPPADAAPVTDQISGSDKAANALVRYATMNCNATMNENTTCTYVVPDPADFSCESPFCCIGECHTLATFTIGGTAGAASANLNSSAFVLTTCNPPGGDYKTNYEDSSCNPNDPANEGKTCDKYCTMGACFSSNPSAPNSGCERYFNDSINCTMIKEAYNNDQSGAAKPVLQAQFAYCFSGEQYLYYNLSAQCWKNPGCTIDQGTGKCLVQKLCKAGGDYNEPSKRCEQCFNASTSACLYSPPTVEDCSAECDESAEGRPLKVSPSEFAQKSQQWMFGRQDIKNVSSLLLPAYLLPLLNIAVTLIFIRTFSPIFGGDIEIPGWTKVL